MMLRDTGSRSGLDTASAAVVAPKTHHNMPWFDALRPRARSRNQKREFREDMTTVETRGRAVAVLVRGDELFAVCENYFIV